MDNLVSVTAASPLGPLPPHPLGGGGRSSLLHLQPETVYGSDGVDGGGGEDDGGGHVMSDRVQSIASGIYREFERMIPKYGEEVSQSINQSGDLFICVVNSLMSIFS